MSRSEGGKNNMFFVVCTQRLQHPKRQFPVCALYMCSKVIQVGAGSAEREM